MEEQVGRSCWGRGCVTFVYGRSTVGDTECCSYWDGSGCSSNGFQALEVAGGGVTVWIHVALSGGRPGTPRRPHCASMCLYVFVDWMKEQSARCT